MLAPSRALEFCGTVACVRSLGTHASGIIFLGARNMLGFDAAKPRVRECRHPKSPQKKRQTHRNNPCPMPWSKT